MKKGEKIVFYVIDKINGENNYDDIVVYKGKDRTMRAIDWDLATNEEKQESTLILIKRPTFHLGEIIIIHEPYGREIEFPYGGRAPRKWDVTWKEFDDIYKAVRYSKKVTPKDI